MAQPLDFTIPYNDLITYVPQNLRNAAVKGLIDNLFNRFMTHDESIPLYGYVGNPPISQIGSTTKVPQVSVERDLNEIIPILNFDLGTKKYAFTVQDLINKARVLGVSQPGESWLYSQSNNYLPPIDIDKFANYYNYFWIAKTLPTAPNTPWNIELLPEYYVIARPADSDLTKMNVLCGTTAPIILTGTGFNSQVFTILFSDPYTFTITASASLGVYHTFGPNATATNQYTFTLSPANSEQTYVDSFSFPVNGPAGIVQLMMFDIQRNPIYDSGGNWVGNESFSTGDSIAVTPTFLTKTYSAVFSGSPGIKGRITNVIPWDTYQTVDGVLLSAGDRILVKNNSNIENGIYVVGPQGWNRASDYAGTNIVAGAEVWIAQGIVNAHRLYISGAGNAWPDPADPAQITSSNTSDWQEGNFWVHGSDLAALGYTRAEVTQAVRPIIEYHSGLKLNTYSLNGIPGDGTIGSYAQVKTEFDQLPMFDLYRYDGTHSGLVSSLFFYVEDDTETLDIDLQKRLKISTDSSGDYVHNHGMVDSNGELLFYKLSGALKTIWHAGYTEPTDIDQTFEGTVKGSITQFIPSTIAVPQTWTLTAVSPTQFTVTGSITGLLASQLTVGIAYSDPQFSITVSLGTIPFVAGEGFQFSIGAGPIVSPITFIGPVKGVLTNVIPTRVTQQQIWTITALNSTQFTVSGSKTAVIPSPANTITVGVPYSSYDFNCLITNGTLAFDSGDTFVLRIGNIETPRYVYRDSSQNIFDLYGGYAADTTGIGAFQVPRPFTYNPYNDASDEVLQGTLFSHFLSILGNQPPGVVNDYAFGGTIKNWSEQQTLLASLLMQRDSTPISIIDSAQQQYQIALNAISNTYTETIAQYFTTSGVVIPDGTVQGDSELDALLDSILAIRVNQNDVRTVLYDTTSPLVGFPATLPQLGVLAPVLPSLSLNDKLGLRVIVHHDGHSTVPYSDDVPFRRSILNNNLNHTVLRSDGTETAAVGSFTTAEPPLPYRGELWIYPKGVDSFMYAFDVDSDLNAPASPIVGSTWYVRSTGPAGTLYIWDGAYWVSQPSHSGQWKLVDLAETLNELIVRAETRLYNGMNPNARVVDFGPLQSNAEFQAQMESELFLYAANNNLVPLGSDYNSGDAFTWNYSQGVLANFPPLSTPTVPARWYNVLKAHQGTVPGVIPTERPNLEPWKLLGYSTLQSWWVTLTGAQQAAYTPYATRDQLGTFAFTDSGYVRAVKTSPGVTTLTGLQVVDGVSLKAGDLVLLTSETAPANNGIWQVSAGTWVRFSTPLVQNMYVTVLEGVQYYGTIWALAAPVPVLNVSPVLFSQVRSWTNELWADVQAARQTLRLSVDTITDGLLSPYVSSTLASAVNALTTVIPSGTSMTYNFGEGSPVETVWLNSVEYGYSLARALFRHDPLMFLGFCWGFNWVSVDGLMYDGFDLNTPGHKRFRLHGDSISSITRTGSSFTIASATGASPLDITFTYDAYEVSGANRYQNFSVRYTNSDSLVSPIGFVREGVTSSISYYGINLTNILIEDMGEPFRIGDSFRLTANADGSNLTIAFTPSTTYKYLGFGQIFTDALRASAIDTTDSFAIDAYRGWDVNMGYRVGGLVSTDDLVVSTETDEMNPNSYSIVFKKNPIASDIWVQGLRITVQQFGASVPKNGALAPKSDGSDWVFYIEGYNPRYTNISYYTLDSTGPYETFNVLNSANTSLPWNHYTSVTGTAATNLPLSITGIQNVATFLFGYSQYLTDAGWLFNQDITTNIDAETGRIRNWQLEVEKFINNCYLGTALGQGHIVNTFLDGLWVNQPTGLLSEFTDTALFDITANPAVFDIAGAKFKAEDLFTIRGNKVSQFNAAAPMYSAHAQVDDYEHVFIMNYYIQDSTQTGLLYQPFSGSRVVTYKFDGRMQASRTFRPEFGGHFLSNGEVLRNVQASADGITQYYDANHAFENELTSKHALALLGFSRKSYFTDLNISDTTQFNFWRGLIHAKGTNMSINAYLNNDVFQDAKIDEYWAYKVATYGDSRQNTYPELKLQVADSIQQFTQLQFDASVGQELTNFTQISKFDETRWFTIDDLDQDAYFLAENLGSYSASQSTSDLVILPFIADELVITGTATTTKINDTTLLVTNSGTLNVTGYGWASPEYNPVKLFNYVAEELVEDIPLWHPAFGQHTPTVLQDVNVIDGSNPAKYNYSTQVVNNNSYDPLRPWGAAEVGRIWFDTSTLSYIPYYDSVVFPNLAERLSRWGALADFGSVSVYEWVQSSVPPSQYNALALLQAGNADLDPTTKAAGEVALQTTYVCDRIWSTRPIAWSYSPVPIAAAHPSFNYSAGPSGATLYLGAGNTISLSSGLFSDHSIVAGSHIGVWDVSNATPAPRSEAIVTNTFSKALVDSAGVTLVPSSVTVGSLTCTVSLAATSYTSIAGPLLFTAEPIVSTPQTDTTGANTGYWNTSLQLRAWETDNQNQSVVSLYTVTGLGTTTIPAVGTVVLQAGQVQTYAIPAFGLTITVSITTGGTFPGDSILNAIVLALGSNVNARDSVGYTTVVDWVSPSGDGFVNDQTSIQYDPTCEWRAWNVPTQAELSADGQQPNASWKPYYGANSTISATLAQIQAAVAESMAPLTLNDGTTNNQFSSSWGDWSALTDTRISAIQTGVGSLTLPAYSSNLNSTTTAVYLNGISQLASAYTITGEVLTFNSVQTGSTGTMIIPAYTPTAAELAFDPTVNDDLTFQQQYKQDYEYVSSTTRNSDGSIGSTVYYFWVKNKNTIAKNKTYSIQTIVQSLTNGPDNYLTFQHLIGSGTNADPYRYDAITISDLSYLIGADNTYKLRFTRDFILRDDPDNLMLKDTHAEWSLIRPGQLTPIPEALWLKLTDSTAAQDAAGNAVPALRRVLYDERNGTSTQFGFAAEQTLAPSSLLSSTIAYTILNTKLTNTNVPPNADGTYPPYFITALDFTQSDTWFSTPANTRATMTTIWNSAAPSQVNEIFFAALNDILANNYQLTDLFKTSRLSAYSIRVISPTTGTPVYE